MRDLRDNLLFRCLCEKVGEHRAHDAFDVIARRMGGLEVRVAIKSVRPGVNQFKDALREAGLDQHEVDSVIRRLGRQKVYVPCHPHDDR